MTILFLDDPEKERNTKKKQKNRNTKKKNKTRNTKKISCYSAPDGDGFFTV